MRYARFLLATTVFFLHCTLAWADLEISVEALRKDVQPGETVNIIVTVSNSGETNLADVTIRAAVPVGVSPFSESKTDANASISCNGGPISSGTCEPGEELIWQIGALAPGQGVSVFAPPPIAIGADAPADGAVISFTATADALNQSTVQSSSQVIVRTQRMVSLALNAEAAPVAPQQFQSFSLIYSNIGSGVSATNAMLELTLPMDVTFLDASHGGVVVGGTVGWSLGDLNPGANGRVTATVAIDAGVGNGRLLSATANLNSSGTVLATAETVTRIATNRALAVATRLGRDVVKGGNAVNVQATVTNPGVTVATNVRVNLVIPDYVENFSEAKTDANGSTSCNGGPVSSGTCEQGERLEWEIGSLAPGDGVTVTMPPRFAGTVTDGVLVPLVAWAKGDANEQAHSSLTTLVDASPLLLVDLRERNSPARPAAALEYTVVYANTSAAASANAVTLTVPVPRATSFVSADRGGLLVGSDVIWTLGDLAAGAAGAVSFAVGVDAAVIDGSFVQAAAHLTASSGDGVWSHSVTRVEADEPLGLSLDLSRSTAGADDTVNALLTVSNRGPSARADVQISAVIPDHVNTFFESKTNANGAASCNGGPISSGVCEQGERLVWNIGTLLPGGGRSVALPPSVAQALSDAAPITIDAWAQDAAGGFARGTRTALARQTQSLVLGLSASASPIAANGRMNFTAHYSNASGLLASAATQLVLPVPPDTTFVNVRNGGNLVGNKVIWELGTLSPGQSGAVSFTTDTDAALVSGEFIQARAYLSNVDGDHAWAQCETRVENNAALALDLRMVSDPVRPGETALSVLSIINHSNVVRSNLQIKAVVPDYVTSFNQTKTTATSSISCNGGPVSSGLCEQGERLVWDIPTLRPGDGFAVTLPPIVASTSRAAAHINSVAWVEDPTNASASMSVTSVVSSAVALELEIVPRSNPVGPGEALVYELVFGQLDVGPGTAILECALPIGATFLSASDGAVFNDGTVTWMLNDLDKGEGGRVTLTLETDDTLDDGALLQTTAWLTNPSLPEQQARARSAVRIAADPGLTLDGAIIGEPLRPGQTDEVRFTVTNSGAWPTTGVVLRVNLADDVEHFSVSDTTANSSASCNGGPISSGLCEQAETLVFMPGTLDAGQSVTVSIPVTTRVESLAGPNGQVTRYQALAYDDAGNFAQQVLARNIGDDDGIADQFDNCLFTPNSAQIDADGDGYGNACDADLNNDCIVNVIDLGLFRTVFFTNNPTADLNGDGVVNVVDLGLLRSLFFTTPGPAFGGICE